MEGSVDPLHARYQVRTKIGFGSYGKVYDATCVATGIAKAIKALDPDVHKSGSDSAEIAVLQTCKHPNIVVLEEVFDAVPGRDCVALVFPAYDTDLGKLLRLRRGLQREFNFPIEHRYWIAKGIWNGLEYMHSMALLHRDIKPANILIAFGDEVRAVLADMGLACDASKAMAIAKPNIVVGKDSDMQCHRTAKVCTNVYVAPEFLCAHYYEAYLSYYGFAVDVWSMTAITFELACAQRFCTSVSSPLDQFSDVVRRLGLHKKNSGMMV